MEILYVLAIIFGRVLHRIGKDHLVEIHLIDHSIRLRAASRPISPLRYTSFAQLDGILEIISLLDEPVGVVVKLLFKSDFRLI